jgi:pyrimidine-nucleoside phosphorylase
MLFYSLIKKKRDGENLTPEEMEWIIQEFSDGKIPDYQMSALLMAIFFNGMTDEELAAWTKAMLNSGEVLSHDHIPVFKVDKHSTGGVGDKISLPLAPLVASYGVCVPMISGRGLGHTGGTLDKLESIPGFRVDLTTERFKSQLEKIGIGLIGQTKDIAPADKKLYALRDVTATVESIPLIASSIMSKKLAEGIDGIVFDVKTGSGAFMKTVDQSRGLAKTLVRIGKSMGKVSRAVISNMDQPIGSKVGNSLEVEESIAVLKGMGPPDTLELTVVLGAIMLEMAGKAKNMEEGRHLVEEAISNGRGLEKLREVIAAQGGDPSVCDDPMRLPHAAFEKPFRAERSGYISRIDTEYIGYGATLLGAGRQKLGDPIDPAVGFTILKRLGEPVEKGEAILNIHYNDESVVDGAEAKLRVAYEIDAQPPACSPLILEIID